MMRLRPVKPMRERGLAYCSSLLAIKAQRERETALLLDAACERALKKIENPK